MHPGREDFYTLDDDEYEVVETGEPREITSDEVKRKLNTPLTVIDQDDFDKKDYTVSDYFIADEDAYVRNIFDEDNRSNMVSSTAIGGVVALGYHLLGDGMSAPTFLGMVALVSTYDGYREQEMDLDEAARNSWEAWSEKLER